MRNKGGYEVIKKAVEKPGLRPIEHIAANVEGNGQRLADRHETSDINTFKWVREKETISVRPADSPTTSLPNNTVQSTMKVLIISNESTYNVFTV
jgi:hypothetical protein